MTRTITVGLDGTPASLAAADWAADEAQLRDLPLRLVTAWEWQPSTRAPYVGLGVQVPPSDLQRASAQRLLDKTCMRLTERRPGLRVDTRELPGLPVPALLKAAEEAELLALGSHGLGKALGYLLGSVSLPVLATCERPVVLVRAGGHAREEVPQQSLPQTGSATARRDVVLGLDLAKPDDAVIGFAFDAASRRTLWLRVVHGWTPPPYYYGGQLTPDLNDGLTTQVRRRLSDVLRPWQEKFPTVEVAAHAVVGHPARHLVDASHEAALVVVGRRHRTAAVGSRIGPVTQALLHHATAPLAVISHS
ncbi:universal stress protein [Streptomyces sp. NPDC004830]